MKFENLVIPCAPLPPIIVSFSLKFRCQCVSVGMKEMWKARHHFLVNLGNFIQF